MFESHRNETVTAFLKSAKSYKYIKCYLLYEQQIKVNISKCLIVIGYCCHIWVRIFNYKIEPLGACVSK